MPRTSNSIPFRVVVSLALGLCAGTVQATIYTVGGDADCDYATIQQAVDALPVGGTHIIRIANSQAYAAQAVSIAGRAVTLAGGYAHCADATSTGGTTLSGQGGGHDSVLTITGTGNDVILDELGLIRGDEVADGYGGGIDFRGAGTLTLRDTALLQNYAGYGGGISVTATGGAAELYLEAGSYIELNTAQFSGGGIRLEGDTHLYMLESGSQISGNEAIGFNLDTQQFQYGYGGGIELIAPAQADIGSPGIGDGTIVGNRARYGGGLAIYSPGGPNGFAIVRLFSTDANQATRIYDNQASHSGGGVYLGANIPEGDGCLCAYDFRIDGNSAQQGAAIYTDTDGSIGGGQLGAIVHLNTQDDNCQRPANLGAVTCSANIPCNTIDDNLTETTDGDPTAGAAILIETAGILDAEYIVLRGNHGAQALRYVNGSDYGSVSLLNSLIADDVVTGNLIRTEDDNAHLHIENTTIAGNVIGGDPVLAVNGDFVLQRSILWQPGKTSLAQSGGTKLAENIVTSERDSLDGGNTVYVIQADPRFEDPGHGDYHPIAASPAVDFASSTGSGPDLDGSTRGVELPIVPNLFGTGDLGAYERQRVFSMVGNHDFLADLRLWAVIVPGVATWNPEGHASAGSVDISIEPAQPPATPDLYAMTQCVHIPGPGDYALNGYGYGASNGNPNLFPRDTVRLHWILRYAPMGESCFSQTPDAEGDLSILAGDTWGEPAEPAVLHIPEEAWTATTSVEILLVVHENGLNIVGQPSDTTGHFDGITLEPVLDDSIFADGFDP